MQEGSRKHRRKHRPEKRLKDVLTQRKLSMEDYLRMKEEQQNLCAICNKPETRRSRTPGDITRLSIDHSHETNKVRGLLCHACNIGIGKFKESIETLESAILYLRKHTV